MDQIFVNLSTNTFSHPHVPGFQLDPVKMSKATDKFLPVAPDVETAVKMSIHEQIQAHKVSHAA